METNISESPPEPPEEVIVKCEIVELSDEEVAFVESDVAATDNATVAAVQPTKKKMTFKIVQTIDRGKFCLWTVPESWESEGILRWPKFQTETLRRDSHSTPEDSWESTNCILKRSNVVGFEMGESFVRLMDADAEESNYSRSHVEELTCNDLRRRYVSQFQTNGSPKTIPETKTPSNFFLKSTQNASKTTPVQLQKPETARLGVNSPSPSVSNNHYTELHSKLETLTTIVSGIAQDQRVLSRNQDIIMNKLCEISNQFDEFMTRSTFESVIPQSSRKRYSFGTSFKPITDKEGFEDLEQLLKNEDNAEELRQYFSVICGEGKEKGITNAYALMDAMFDRHFLLECSWSGGSRSEITKICFKSYQNVIDFFFSLIHASDKQFTKLQCQTFLQTVLRNSVKRSESKKMRRSTRKIRRKMSVAKQCEIPVLDNATAESLLEIIRVRDDHTRLNNRTENEQKSSEVGSD